MRSDASRPRDLLGCDNIPVYDRPDYSYKRLSETKITDDMWLFTGTAAFKALGETRQSTRAFVLDVKSNIVQGHGTVEDLCHFRIFLSF